MENILNELFKLLNDNTRSPETAKAAQQAKHHYAHLLALAEDSEELDAIWGAAVAVGEADRPAWFARGFRLGARLMLAVLDRTPVVPE